MSPRKYATFASSAAFANGDRKKSCKSMSKSLNTESDA